MRITRKKSGPRKIAGSPRRKARTKRKRGAGGGGPRRGRGARRLRTAGIYEAREAPRCRCFSPLPGRKSPSARERRSPRARRESKRAEESRNRKEARRGPSPAEPLAPAEKPLTFDTSDLDKIGRTTELGKEQVESFLDVLKERERRKPARPGRGPGARGSPAALGGGDQRRGRRTESRGEGGNDARG